MKFDEGSAVSSRQESGITLSDPMTVLFTMRYLCIRIWSDKETDI